MSKNQYQHLRGSKSFISAIWQLDQGPDQPVHVRDLNDDADLYYTMDLMNEWKSTSVIGPTWDVLPCPNDPGTMIHRWTFAGGDNFGLIAIQFLPHPVRN